MSICFLFTKLCKIMQLSLILCSLSLSCTTWGTFRKLYFQTPLKANYSYCIAKVYLHLMSCVCVQVWRSLIYLTTH